MKICFEQPEASFSRVTLALELRTLGGAGLPKLEIMCTCRTQALVLQLTADARSMACNGSVTPSTPRFCFSYLNTLSSVQRDVWRLSYFKHEKVAQFNDVREIRPLPAGLQTRKAPASRHPFSQWSGPPKLVARVGLLS